MIFCSKYQHNIKINIKNIDIKKVLILIQYFNKRTIFSQFNNFDY